MRLDGHQSFLPLTSSQKFMGDDPLGLVPDYDPTQLGPETGTFGPELNAPPWTGTNPDSNAPGAYGIKTTDWALILGGGLLIIGAFVYFSTKKRR